MSCLAQCWGRANEVWDVLSDPLCVLAVGGLFDYLLCAVMAYQVLVPALLWSNSTLYLNVVANRQGWRACKRFRWCDEKHQAPKREIIWRGEATFTA